MGHCQHRLPPHPSYQLAHHVLPSPRSHGKDSRVSERENHHAEPCGYLPLPPTEGMGSRCQPNDSPQRCLKTRPNQRIVAPPPSSRPSRRYSPPPPAPPGQHLCLGPTFAVS